MVEQKLKLKAFGIAREIMGGREIEIDSVSTVAELRKLLVNNYPMLKELNSLMIAVNQTYANDDLVVSSTDEIAVIPPVSGG
jgi:molybdopterin synthase sulfur carrier subunit